MSIGSELAETVAIYQEKAELEEKIQDIQAEVEQKEQEIIKSFFPYLLSIYADWRPAIGEVAVHLSLDTNICYAVIIRSIDGYRIRAQEGDKSAYHRFELNPVLEEYIVAHFIIPAQNYEELKDLFNLTYLGPKEFETALPSGIQ